MRPSARTPSVLIAALLAAAPALAAEKGADPALAEAQALVREAAALERSENCEGAWAKYKAAEEKVAEVSDRAAAADVEAIATNKLDKLDACYRACQPTERQRGLVEKAKGFAGSGEVKRATQIVKRMLVGRDEKCQFWGGVRTFLRSLPRQAEEQDLEKLDPCEVTAEVTQALEEAKAAARRHREELEEFEAKKAKLAGKLGDLVELFHAIDATRVRLFELREEYLDCESVYGPLVEDAGSLKETYARAEDLIFSTYKAQVAGLAAKVRRFQKELAAKDEKLKAGAEELARLKKDYEALSAFNETLYDDLFNLAGSESLSFATTVEGKRIDLPAEEIQALMADQGKVLKALSSKYPEYFQDGVHVEGLKRKRFVLEKLEQMMERMGKRGGEEKLGHGRAVAEVQATLKMMDKAIAAGEKAAAMGPASAPAAPVGSGRWLLGAGALLVAGGALLGIVVLRRRKDPQA